MKGIAGNRCGMPATTVSRRVIGEVRATRRRRAVIAVMRVRRRGSLDRVSRRLPAAAIASDLTDRMASLRPGRAIALHLLRLAVIRPSAPAIGTTERDTTLRGLRCQCRATADGRSIIRLLIIPRPRLNITRLPRLRIFLLPIFRAAMAAGGTGTAAEAATARALGITESVSHGRTGINADYFRISDSARPTDPLGVSTLSSVASVGAMSLGRIDWL